MTPDQIALAREWVALPGFRWMPGMRYALHPSHVARGIFDRVSGELADDDGHPVPESPPTDRGPMAIPDVTDHATEGCLRELMREVTGDPEAHTALGAAGWVVLSGESRVADVVLPGAACATEVEALLRAAQAVRR